MRSPAKYEIHTRKEWHIAQEVNEKETARMNQCFIAGGEGW